MGDHELYAAYAQADVHIQAGSVNALIAGVEARREPASMTINYL